MLFLGTKDLLLGPVGLWPAVLRIALLKVRTGGDHQAVSAERHAVPRPGQCGAGGAGLTPVGQMRTQVWDTVAMASCGSSLLPPGSGLRPW